MSLFPFFSARKSRKFLLIQHVIFMDNLLGRVLAVVKYHITQLGARKRKYKFQIQLYNGYSVGSLS